MQMASMALVSLKACVILAVAVLPSLAMGSYENIYGICNQYSQPVHFINLEHSGNNCVAPPGGTCDTKHAWIPKVKSASDYPKHHMSVQSQDGKISWNIWKNDGQGEIRGGTDFGTGTDMTKEIGKGQWNIVIDPSGQVSLFASATPGDCPATPKNCNSITKKSGSWQYVQSVSSKQSITLKHGVTHGYTNTDTKSWSESVEVSASDSFGWIGGQSTITVSSTTAHAVSKSYSKTFSETDETDFTDEFGAGTLWQYKWHISDECGKSEVKGTDVVLTKGQWQPPCCLPGFAADPANYAGKCMGMPGEKVYTLCSGELNGTVVI